MALLPNLPASGCKICLTRFGRLVEFVATDDVRFLDVGRGRDR
jgi:hypothetical protein